jgi:hypothetical protein
MRCDDVIRELAAPTDARDSASLSEHLNHCSSCAAWAERAARLNRLWQVTQPVEPTSDVWDHVWAQVISSLDVQTTKGVISPAVTSLRNGLGSGTPPTFTAKPNERSLTRPFRSKRLAAIAIVGLAQAAAVLLVAGMSWQFFVPSRTPQTKVIASLPSVDIEEGHLVMIVADPKLLSVVDLTPKTMTAGVDHVDWYGDEKYFDWFQVYHEVESLAKPTVAMMKE